jgi:hypothetical protein
MSPTSYYDPNHFHRHLSLPILNQIENHSSSNANQQQITVNGDKLTISDLIQNVNSNSIIKGLKVVLSDQAEIQNGIQKSYEFMTARVSLIFWFNFRLFHGFYYRSTDVHNVN